MKIYMQVMAVICTIIVICGLFIQYDHSTKCEARGGMYVHAINGWLCLKPEATIPVKDK